MPEGVSANAALLPERAALEFARCLPDGSVLAVALSGGGDSVGLLVALHEAFRVIGRGLCLTAVTVDHALRAQSANEAATAAEMCRTLAIPHVTMVWTGEKPKTGLMEAAREARYHLLLEGCQRLGAAALVTAHTRDDQFETAEMRLRRGVGQARGLAGMAPASLYFERLWAYRPFLNVTRADIRVFLRRMGMDWVDDPSNDNPLFERVRVRQGGRFSLGAGDIAARALLRSATAADAAALCRRHVDMPLPLLFRIDGAAMEDEPAFQLLLRSLVAVAGGQTHLPGTAQVERVLGRIAGQGGAISLGRTVVERRGGQIHIGRDRRNLPPKTEGCPPVWDGRFELVEETCEAPAAPPARRVVSPLAPRIARRALDVLPPGLTDGTEAVPTRWRPVLSPYRTVLPVFDLPVANAIAQQAGRSCFPAPIDFPAAGG